MKKLMVVAAIGLLAYFWAYPKWMYSDSGLKSQAGILNQAMPVKWTPELTVISVEHKPVKQLIYHIEFQMNSELMAPNASETINAPANKKIMAGFLCKDQVIFEGMKRGANLAYEIHTKDQKPITTLSFTKDDCA